MDFSALPEMITGEIEQYFAIHFINVFGQLGAFSQKGKVESSMRGTEKLKNKKTEEQKH